MAGIAEDEIIETHYVMTAVGSLYWALDAKVNDEDSLVAPNDPDEWASWLDNVLKGKTCCGCSIGSLPRRSSTSC